MIRALLTSVLLSTSLLSSVQAQEDNLVVLIPINPGVQLSGELPDSPDEPDEPPVPDETAPDNSDFYRVGATIFCPDAAVGDTGMIDGVEYTKRGNGEINAANAATACTSGITNMSFMFIDATAFNADIGHWDVSKVTNMSYMFWGATAFNQDLSGWCVSQFPSEPHSFSTGTTAWYERYKPIWGEVAPSCPNP